MKLGDVLRSVKRTFAINKKTTDTTTTTDEKATVDKTTVKKRITTASATATASVRAASSKALSHGTYICKLPFSRRLHACHIVHHDAGPHTTVSSTGKALVSKLACHRKPAVKEEADETNTQEDNIAAKTAKPRRTAVSKAPLMIAARGEDEQLVVADAQVVVPTYDGPTEAPLPPPAALFANATTLDRLAREEAARRAQEELVA